MYLPIRFLSLTECDVRSTYSVYCKKNDFFHIYNSVPVSSTLLLLKHTATSYHHTHHESPRIFCVTSKRSLTKIAPGMGTLSSTSA